MAKTKPKILVFIDWFLPGYKAGGPIQSCANLTRALSDQFDFYVITRNTDYCEKKPYPTVKSDQWNQLEANIWVYYFSEEKLGYFAIKSVAKQINADKVYINGIYSPYFSILPVLIGKALKKPTIVAARGMLATSAIQIKSAKKKLLLTLLRTLGFYRKVTFHATNETEKQDIRNSLGENSRVEIIDNLPKQSEIEWNNVTYGKPGTLRLVWLARISQEKNISFALQALKSVKSKVFFDIYGPVYDNNYWEACQEQIKLLPANVEVKYLGVVDPENVQTTFYQYDLLFLPTLGENYGHVIVQAWAAGLPVLISDCTPWKKLKDEDIGAEYSLSNLWQFAEFIDEFALKSNEDRVNIKRACRSKFKTVSENSYQIDRYVKLFLS